MSDIFHSFVESAKSIAVENNVKWDTPTRTDGKILKPYIWDLSKMSGSPPTPRILLTNLRPDKRTKEDYLEQCLFETLPEEWCDLIKAVIVRKIFINRNLSLIHISEPTRPY